MEEFKGTLGPWSVDGSNYHDYGIVSDANGEEVTTLPAENSEHDFNAMLIAAAPELLEALQELVHADTHGIKNCSAQVNALEKAKSAIAKALGK